VSKNDLSTYSVIDEFIQGRITRKAAAMMLSRSERQISRIACEVKKNGLPGVFHKNRGRAPHNKTDQVTKRRATNLAAEKYFDFNLAHAHEKICEEVGLKQSYETFWRWCKARGIAKKKYRRRHCERQARTRVPCEGILIQFDGSHHKWNNVDTWVLIGGIDDATSKVVGAKFCSGETTLDSMAVLRLIIENYGVPSLLYVDKAGIFGGGKRHGFAHFVHACDELGIKIIFAHSPQAKGRIERLWNTFQDRLIPEMRLRGVKTMREANDFMQREFIPNWFNSKLTVPAQDPSLRWREAPAAKLLDHIFTTVETRQIRNDLTISFNGDLMQLTSSKVGLLLPGRTVEIRSYPDGKTCVTCLGEEVTLKPLKKPFRTRNSA
jgi:transposase